MSVDRYDSMGFKSEHGIYVRAVDYDEQAMRLSDDNRRWVPVTERPLPRPEREPEDIYGGTFLVANAKGQVAPWIRGVIHNNIGSPWDWDYGCAITHWMPLPEAPKCP